MDLPRSFRRLKRAVSGAAGRRIIVVVLASVILTGLIFAAVYPNQSSESGFVNFVGTVASTFAHPLATLAAQLTVESQVGPGSAPTGDSIGWSKTPWSGVQDLFFSGSAGGQRVQLSNASTGKVSDYNATTLGFGFDTFPTCSNLAIINSQYDAEFQGGLTTRVVQIVYAQEDVLGIRVTPAFGEMYSLLAVTATATESASAVSFMCNHVNMTANGINVVMNGSTFVKVTQFSQAFIQLSVAVDESFWISGPAALTLRSGNANWTGVRFQASTQSEDIPPQQGVDLLRFDSLQFTLPAQTLTTSAGAPMYAIPVTGTQVQMLTLGNSIGLVNPSLVQTYAISDENARRVLSILLPLILGAFLPWASGYVQRAIQTNLLLEDTLAPEPGEANGVGKETPALSKDSRRRIVPTVVLVSVIVLGGVVGAYMLLELGSNHPLLYFLARYPVTLDVFEEASTNTDALNASYLVLLPVLRSMLSNSNVTVHISIFPTDGITSYNPDSHAYSPAGVQALDPFGISQSRKVQLYVVHHDGSLANNGWLFSGTTYVFFDGGQIAPLDEARLLLELMAYSWGVPFDPCSPMMSGGGPQYIPVGFYAAAPKNLSGVPVYSEVLNHTFNGMKGWGTLLVRNLGYTFSPVANVTESEDFYLFGSNVTGFAFYEVVYIRSRGNSSAFDSDTVQVSYAILETYTRAWTASELEFIRETIQGSPVLPPTSGVIC